MKKIFLFVVCAAMAIGSANAQAGKLQLGVKAGVNFTGLWGDGAEDSKGKLV